VTKRPRAVFDTNVFVSASLSKNANSPTRELLERWKRNEFTLLVCNQIAKELIEILTERGLTAEEIVDQISALARSANYLVTYDPHFDTLGGNSRGIKIVKAIPFLEALRRGDGQPG